MNSFLLKKSVFILFFGLMAGPVQAQLYTDTEGRQWVQQALDQLYNFRFEAVAAPQARLLQKYPQHPVGPMLEALTLYWQHQPLTASAAAMQRYRRLLAECIRRAETLDKTPAYHTEATFFLLASHSYLAALEADLGEYTRAVSEARRTYKYLKEGFVLKDRNPEFFFSTGLYNYYREQYPEDRPIVKPFMIFFDAGNRQLGLRQMEQAWQQGTFTRTEAGFYLIYVLLKHEDAPLRALPYATALTARYPGNPFFLMKHAECLLLAGRYEEAVPLLMRLNAYQHPIFKTAHALFSGLKLEKIDHSDTAAAQQYRAVLARQPDARYTADYHAMAWAGLARLADRAGKKAEARDFYARARRMAEYKRTLDEARRYLR